MIRNYQRRIPIKAEQFDGSKGMMNRYDITDDGWGDTFTVRSDNKCLPLKVGWWIVDLGRSEVLGVTLHELQTMPDEKFRERYVRCD